MTTVAKINRFESVLKHNAQTTQHKRFVIQTVPSVRQYNIQQN